MMGTIYNNILKQFETIPAIFCEREYIKTSQGTFDRDCVLDAWMDLYDICATMTLQTFAETIYPWLQQWYEKDRYEEMTMEALEDQEAINIKTTKEAIYEKAEYNEEDYINIDGEPIEVDQLH